MSDTTGITQAGYSEIRDCSKDEPLTKRERVAMAAMQGLCANPHSVEWAEQTIAQLARRQADYLIAELNSTHEPE
jgi:hypothetical protein